MEFDLGRELHYQEKQVKVKIRAKIRVRIGG